MIDRSVGDREPIGIELTVRGDRGLRLGPVGHDWVHLCIDMQRMFSETTEWQTPWMPRVLPNVLRIVELAPQRTFFTRFIPPRRAEPATEGTWRRYYPRYHAMTRDELDPGLLGLMPELLRHVPPAKVVDKARYSPWLGTGLHETLWLAGVRSVLITGAETKVCVLAAVIGAIDLAYRVLVVTDAICSSADTTHDAMVSIYHSRYSMQVETATSLELMQAKLDGDLMASG